MGELTALIAHEIKQPLAAIVTRGDFCLRQRASAAPVLQEVREAIVEIVNYGNRASAIIPRARALLMKRASRACWHYLRASTMKAKERKPRKATSSFSKREKMRR
jgi:signal transduction histidine kinase